MVGLPPFNTPMLDGQSTNNRCGPTTLEVTGIDYTVDTSNLDSIGGAQETQPLSLRMRFVTVSGKMLLVLVVILSHRRKA